MALLQFLLLASLLQADAVAPPKLRKTSAAAVASSALRLRTIASAATNLTQAPSFQAYYSSHSTGRGIWKWNNALVAYDRHCAKYAGQPVKFMEVGVQSGGSIEMWRSVLGDQTQFYGMDINANTMQFNDPPRVTISLGDQGDPAMWSHFFKHVTPDLDVLVDDGGHEPHQMLTTLQSAWPHINPGGFVSIEDIHGAQSNGKYFHSFFVPTAQFLGAEASKNTLDSVHVYPFVVIAQKAGNAAPLQFSGAPVYVSEFQQIWDAIRSGQNWGNHVVLQNAGWGRFLTAQGIQNFFLHFQDLHDSNWFDMPTGCERTSAPVCTNRVVSSQMQREVTGIHIYKDRLIVEVPSTPPVIEAVRRGNVWIGYGL